MEIERNDKIKHTKNPVYVNSIWTYTHNDIYIYIHSNKGQLKTRGGEKKKKKKERKEEISYREQNLGSDSTKLKYILSFQMSNNHNQYNQQLKITYIYIYIYNLT